MKDQLEDFIRDNRAAFDDREPNDKNWQKINQQLFKSSSLWNSIVVWRVAAIVLLGVCIYLAIPDVKNQRENTLAMKEFKDIESFYISQISEKVSLIESQRGQDVGLNAYTTDFRQLEAMYQVLKEEMKNQPSEKVKDALVLNLLVRIDLLNQQLHNIEQGEEEKKEQEGIANT